MPSPIGPEQQRLLDRLFNDPERRTLNFKFTPGEHPTSAEAICQQINYALDQIESGQAEEVDPVRSERPSVDVRVLIERL